MRQQSRFRSGQIDRRPERTGKHIASRKKADPGKKKIFVGSDGRRFAAASDPNDPLYRLVQTDDVDRRHNTIRSTRDAEVFDLLLLGIAHH